MIRSPSHLAGFLAIAALATVAGCFSLSRDAPPVEHYVLSGARTLETAAPQDPAGVTLGMRRLDLAEYLATPLIVVRRGAHQIDASDYHRWGEDLGHGISRAVATYLAAAAPVRAIDVAPWPTRSRFDYLIQLHVSRFEGVAPEDASATDGEVHLLASWEIIRQHDEAVLARGGTDYRQPGWTVGDYAGLVALLDRGLAVLARDLITSLSDVAAAPRPEQGDGA